MSNTIDTSFNSSAFRLNTDLVIIQMVAKSAKEVVERLSNVLITQGYVKLSYLPSAVERERTCPTGLPTPGLGTAIPHGAPENTLKPGIAVATLAQPVKFGELGDPRKKVKVSVVFMLSVTQPDDQIYLLKSIVSVYKDEAALRKLHAASSPQDLVQQINEALSLSFSQTVA